MNTQHETELLHYRATLLHYNLNYTKEETIITTRSLRAAKIKATKWATPKTHPLKRLSGRWRQCVDYSGSPPHNPVDEHRKDANDSMEDPVLFITPIKGTINGQT